MREYSKYNHIIRIQNPLSFFCSLNPAREYDHMARPLVYGTGEVMWLPKVKHVIGCTGSSREIVCSMKVISWHYSGNQVGNVWRMKALII